MYIVKVELSETSIKPKQVDSLLEIVNFVQTKIDGSRFDLEFDGNKIGPEFQIELVHKKKIKVVK